MPAADASSMLEAIGRILDDSHVARPDQLGRVLAEAVELAGWQMTIYLVDVEQRTLRPLPNVPIRVATDISESHDVDGTLAGRCFRLSAPVAAHTPDEHTWIPLIDGVDRLGVIKLRLPSGQTLDDPATAGHVRWVSYLIAHVLAGKFQLTDHFQAVRQTRARSVPSELIWSTLPPLTIACDGVAIAGGLEPSYTLGGDVFDYAIDGSVAHVAIADATGHDVAASVIGAMVLAGYRTARRIEPDLAAVARSLDRALHELGRGSFATGVFGQLDMQSGRFQYVNAGHPAPLLLRGGKIVKRLDAGRRPLLGLRHRQGDSAVEQLEHGDWLILCTDGVTEARDEHRQFFGLERLIDVVERCAADRRSAAETLRRVMHAVLDHQQSVLQDDASVVVVQWMTGLEHTLTAT